MIAGGLRAIVRVIPKKWIHRPIYTADDLPTLPPSILQPSIRCQLPPQPPTPPSSQSDSEAEWQIDDDGVTISLTVMREILRGVDPNLLPHDMAKAIARDRKAIRRNNATFRRPKQPPHQADKSPNHRQQHIAGEQNATKNPPQQPTVRASPSSHVVHGSNVEKRARDSMQVSSLPPIRCSHVTLDRVLGDNNLFPEIELGERVTNFLENNIHEIDSAFAPVPDGLQQFSEPNPSQALLI